MNMTVGGYVVSVERRGSWYRITLNGELAHTVRGKQAARKVILGLHQAQNALMPPTRMSKPIAKQMAEKIRRDIDAIGQGLDDDQRTALIKEAAPGIMRNAAYAAVTAEMLAMHARHQETPQPWHTMAKDFFMAMTQHHRWIAPRRWTQYRNRALRYARRVGANYIQTGKVNAQWNS